MSVSRLKRSCSTTLPPAASSTSSNMPLPGWATARPVRAERRGTQCSARWRHLEAERVAVVTSAPDSTAPVADLAAHRNRRNWRQLVAVAAAAALLLGTGIGVANVILKDSKNPPGRSVALRAPDGGVPIRIVLERNGTGAVRSSDLPPALAGHVYQLWAQSSATAPMHSAGLLGRSPKGHHVRVPAGSFRIAVSVEPDGGSIEPTTDPVAVSGTL